MIKSVLESSTWTSAGGKNPVDNFIKQFRGTLTEAQIEELIRTEVKRIVKEERQEISEEETQIENNLGTSTEEKAGGGFESGAIGAVRTGTGLAQNPGASIGMLMRFIPHAALVTLALSLIPIIIDELKKPGSIMDIRWKRMMQDEFNAFLDRQEQMNVLLGYRQVIVQSKAGFIAQSSGAGTYDTVRDKREGGMDKDRQEIMGLKDHAKQLPKTAFYNG